MFTVQSQGADARSKAINQKLNGAEVIQRPRNPVERDEGFRAFEEADALSVEANLFWKWFYRSDQRRLESLRKGYEHAKSLRDEFIETSRTWLTEGGIEAVNKRYIGSFVKLGLFPANRPNSDFVSNADQAKLIAVVNERPTVRRVTLSAIDHWLSVIYLSKDAGTKWAASAKLLWDATLELEQDESERPSLRELRQLVGQRDAASLDRLTQLFAAKPPDRLAKGVVIPFATDELRAIPSSLFGQVYGCLASNGRAEAARQVATRMSAVKPHDAVVNGTLVSAAENLAEAARAGESRAVTRLSTLSTRQSVAFPQLAAVAGAAVWVAALNEQQESDRIKEEIGWWELKRAVALTELRQYAYALTANDSKNPLYQNWYGKALSETGVLYEAVERFELALKLSAEQGRPFALAHSNLGTAYLALYRYGDAIREYEAAILESTQPSQQADDEVAYHYGLAKAHQNCQRDPERVVREAQWCIDWFGRHPKGPPPLPGAPPPGEKEKPWDPGDDRYTWAKLILGNAYLDMGRASDALSPLEQATLLRPTIATTHLRLGKCYAALDRIPDAIEAVEQAVALEPSVAAVLVELYIDTGNLKKAREWAEQAKNMLWLGQVEVAEKGQQELSAYDAKPVPNPSHTVGLAAVRVQRYTTVATALRDFLEIWSKEGHAKNPDCSVEENLAQEHLTPLAIGSMSRSGRVGDADKPKNPKELNTLALTWANNLLRGMSARHDRVKAGSGDTREDLIGLMTSYQTSRLLSFVREAESLKALEPEERRGWELFWKTWNELLQKVRALPLDPETGRPSRLGNY